MLSTGGASSSLGFNGLPLAAVLRLDGRARVERGARLGGRCSTPGEK